MSEEINYLMNLIKKKTGLTEELIWEKIRNDPVLSGSLISKKGALILLASELGVPLPKKKTSSTPFLKLKDLIPGMRRVRVAGRVKRIFPLLSFKRKNGAKGEVKKIIIFDSSQEAVLTLWNEAARSSSKIRPGDIVKVSNAKIIQGLNNKLEIHVNSASDLEINPENLDTKLFPCVTLKFQKILDIENEANEISVRGFISNKFDVKTFIRKNGSTGSVSFLELADKTGKIPVIFWNKKKFFEKVREGDMLELRFAKVKFNRGYQLEIHVTNSTNIILNPSQLIGNKPFLNLKNLNPGFIREKVFVRVFGGAGLLPPELFCAYDLLGFAQLQGDKEVMEKISSLSFDTCISISNFQVESNNHPLLKIFLDKRSIIQKEHFLDKLFPTLSVLHNRRSLNELAESFYEVKGTLVEFRKFKFTGNSLILNCLIDDGSGVLIVNLTGVVAEKLLGKTLKQIKSEMNSMGVDEYSVSEINKGLLGQEFIFSGFVKYNSLTGFLEMNCAKVEKANPISEALIEAYNFLKTRRY